MEVPFGLAARDEWRGDQFGNCLSGGRAASALRMVRRRQEEASARLVVSTNEEALVGDPMRMLLHEPEAIEAVQVLTEQFSQDCRTETYYEPDGRVHSLCVLPREADKGSALEFVARKLKIPLVQTLAIGDNTNDMPMFAAAGVSAAMGNATQAWSCATVVALQREGRAWAAPRFALGHSH